MDLSSVLSFDPNNQNLALTAPPNPSGMLQNAINQPTTDDVNAAGLQDISDNFKGGLTPLTAVLKGFTAGAAQNLKMNAQQKRDAQQAMLTQRLQKLSQWQMQDAQHTQELRDLAASAQYSQAKQQPFGDAFIMAQNGNSAPLVGLVKADDATNRVILGQSGLPPDTNLTDLHYVTGVDGQPTLVAAGMRPDGSTVTGTTPIPFMKALGAIAPQTQAQLLASQAASSAATTKAADEHAVAQSTVAKNNADAAKDTATAPQGGKPLPAQAAKLQDETLGQIGTLGITNGNISKAIADIDTGKLDTSLTSRGTAFLHNITNSSTPESRALADYTSNIKKLVNDSLLLNKGVQTEGDAQRAADAIMAAPYDTQAVKQRLQELQQLNQRAADLKKIQNDQLRSEYGRDPLDYSKFESQTPAQSFSEGQTATNPKTGQKIIFKGGQWVGQ